MGKPIRIKIRKYLDQKNHFEPYVEVLSVDALGQRDLPGEYVYGLREGNVMVDRWPSCVYTDKHCPRWDDQPKPSLKITNKKGGEFYLASTVNYPREEFMKMLDVLKQCAKRLSNLKWTLLGKEERNKKKYADWVGEEEITI